ncbi:MAG: aminopeptidase [Planctomycetota bacterium]|nr:aminopeptidase [Planctomycetota bacterium]
MKTPRSSGISRLQWIFLVGLLLFSCGCHAAWIASNGSGVAHRLASSRPHARLLSDLEVSSELRSRLVALPDLLQFARDKGLKVGQAYQRVDPIPGPVSWIVVAADPKTMTLHHWSFPLVGAVPYKGYRFREHAQKEADQLTTFGWEADVLAVPAWSSLGWFPEPLPWSLLGLEEHRMATTVLHELVHRTVHLPSHSQLNEGLATFLAGVLAQEWLISRHGEDAEPVRRQRLLQSDEMALNRILRRYRSGLLSGEREPATQQFLEALGNQRWGLFSGPQLAEQSWSLARVLLAEVYDPEALPWDRIWVESGQSVPNLIIKLQQGNVGTKALESTFSPLEGTFGPADSASLK